MEEESVYCEYGTDYEMKGSPVEAFIFKMVKEDGGYFVGIKRLKEEDSLKLLELLLSDIRNFSKP